MQIVRYSSIGVSTVRTPVAPSKPSKWLEYSLVLLSGITGCILLYLFLSL